MTTKHNPSQHLKTTARSLAAVGHLIIIILACSLSGSFAQERTPKKETRAPFERFAAGLRMGIALTNTIRGGSGTEFVDNIDPFTGLLESVTIVTTSASAPTTRFAWGPTFQFNLSPRIGVNLEFVTRTVEFETSVTTELDAPNLETVQFITSRVEQTQARYWDFPVLLRYYLNDPGGGPRPYLTGGFALRKVTSLAGTLETIDEEDLELGTSEITDAATVPANETGGGAAIGIGLHLVDDVGVKLEIEARFTRWLQRSFASGLANSNQNQVEVLIGITF